MSTYVLFFVLFFFPPWMFRPLNKDGALFSPKKPPRNVQYPGRPLGRTRSRVLLPSPVGRLAGVSPRPGAA